MEQFNLLNQKTYLRNLSKISFKLLKTSVCIQWRQNSGSLCRRILTLQKPKGCKPGQHQKKNVRIRGSTIGTIHILCQPKGWVGEFRKWQFLLMFGTVLMLAYWVGGSEKLQKCADVIYGWPHRRESIASSTQHRNKNNFEVIFSFLRNKI